MREKARKTISLLCIVFNLIFNLIEYEYDFGSCNIKEKKKPYSYTIYV